MADALLGPCHQELVDRAFGAVVDAVEAVRQAARGVDPQHLGLDVRPRELLGLLGRHGTQDPAGRSARGPAPP